ncbi:MAG: hypothetical protein KJ000_16165 [Pirellulaceae bacterium]|nr:hypothetical protein [Pirellulaceae bacterium]
MNAKFPVVPSVLNEHLEQLTMLWQQRQDAQRSPDYLREDVARLDERLEAHVDGLLLAGEQAIPLLEESLASEEPAAVFAAAFVLLRQEQPGAATRVVEALLLAEQGQLTGIRQALCHGPIALIEARLREICESGQSAAAVAALEVLAYHQRATGLLHRLARFYVDENPVVRQAAWRITAMLPETNT